MTIGSINNQTQGAPVGGGTGSPDKPDRDKKSLDFSAALSQAQNSQSQSQDGPPGDNSGEVGGGTGTPDKPVRNP